MEEWLWWKRAWQLSSVVRLKQLYAIEDSQSKAFIADLEPDRRATAVGAYNFVTGVLYLPASLVAGALWTVDARWAFALSALLSVAAAVLFVQIRPASARAF